MVIWTDGRLKEFYNLIVYNFTQNQDFLFCLIYIAFVVEELTDI